MSAPHMAREGRIVALTGHCATVRFERESACSACRAAKVCAGNTPTSELTVPLPPGSTLRVGDKVRVGVDEAAALRATGMAYLTPLAGLAAGMALAALTGLPEGAVAAASFAGLGAGLLAMRRLARHPAYRLQPALMDEYDPDA